MTQSNSTLDPILRQQAARCMCRIGIGIKNPSEAVVASLQKAAAFCVPVIFGSSIPGFECVADEDIVGALFKALEAKRIDGVIRGQYSCTPFRETLVRICGKQFNPIAQLISILEDMKGRPFVMNPSSNLHGWTLEEKEKLIDASVAFCQAVGLPVKIGVLSMVRQENLAEDIPRQFRENAMEAEELVRRFKDRYEITHYGIEFETAITQGATVIMEPNGTVGNQIIRTLYFLEAARYYGSPVMNTPHVTLESLRNGADFTDHLLLAAALASARKQKQ